MPQLNLKSVLFEAHRGGAEHLRLRVDGRVSRLICPREVRPDANEANEPALRLYRSVGFGSWSEAAGGNDLFMRLRL